MLARNIGGLSLLNSKSFKNTSDRILSSALHVLVTFPFAFDSHTLGKLIYCTRTVQEMDKVMAELKQLIDQRAEDMRSEGLKAPDILAVCLSSRRNMCIHPEVLLLVYVVYYSVTKYIILVKACMYVFCLFQPPQRVCLHNHAFFQPTICLSSFVPKLEAKRKFAFYGELVCVLEGDFYIIQNRLSVFTFGVDDIKCKVHESEWQILSYTSGNVM